MASTSEGCVLGGAAPLVSSAALGAAGAMPLSARVMALGAHPHSFMAAANVRRTWADIARCDSISWAEVARDATAAGGGALDSPASSAPLKGAPHCRAIKMIITMIITLLSYNCVIMSFHTITPK